jgi:Leucine-rich repeat (LRR) protein
MPLKTAREKIKFLKRKTHMKKLIKIGLVLTTILTCTYAIDNNELPEPNVDIHYSESPLTYLKINQVLDAMHLEEYPRLTSLEMEYCFHLRNVDEIVCLHPLKKVVFFGCVALKDNYAPVARLPNLTTLTLSNIFLTTVEPLRNAPQLTSLTLNANPLASIEPICSLPLKMLSLHRCEQLTDVDKVGLITTLEELDLSDLFYYVDKPTWKDKHLTYLTSLAILRSLNLAINPGVANTSVLAHLTNLTSLDITSTSITDIRLIENLPHLIHLKKTDEQGTDA